VLLTETKISVEYTHTPELSERSSKMMTSYCLIRNLPVWKFFYKGNHSKPVRTTLAVVEVKGDIVTGYVLRRGNEVCNRLQDAKIASFKKSGIALVKGGKKTTLSKHNLTDLIVNGA
jgi:hypothetical protein